MNAKCDVEMLEKPKAFQGSESSCWMPCLGASRPASPHVSWIGGMWPKPWKMRSAEVLLDSRVTLF